MDKNNKDKKKTNIPADVKNIISRFNELSNAKYRQSLNTKLLLLFCSIAIVCVNFFAYRFASDAMNKIIVVDSAGGEIRKIKAEQEDELYKALLLTHCQQTGHYVNSFDRLTLTENQQKAEYLVMKSELDRIFQTYTSQKAYYDCVNRGIVYKYDFKNILTAKNVGGNEYQVRFIGVLSIIDAGSTRKIKVTSFGTTTRVEAKWPHNVTGYKFRTYTQEYEEIGTEYLEDSMENAYTNSYGQE